MSAHTQTSTQTHKESASSRSVASIWRFGVGSRASDGSLLKAWGENLEALRAAAALVLLALLACALAYADRGSSSDGGVGSSSSSATTNGGCALEKQSAGSVAACETYK